MDIHSTIQDPRGPGKNKRKWNNEEDAKLIEALHDMVNLGKFKAENGFKSGYLHYLEDKLKDILPNSGLKAKPHIESRIKTLRKDFTIVYDMLNGPNTSGFGMDPIKHCVTAEKPVWDAYLKSHPNHLMWQNKPFPFYEDLIVIFGKDRATGANAEAPGDMMEEIEKQNTNHDTDDNIEATIDSGLDDFGEAFSPLQSPRAEGVHVQKKKRRSSSFDSLTTSIKEAASVIGSEIAKSSQIFSKAIGVDAEISEKRKIVDSEIRKIPHLTRPEIIKVVREIGKHDDLIDLFFSMDQDGKEDLVKDILGKV